MACRTMEEKIQLHLRGELPDAETEALRSHLASCDDCSDLMAAYQQLESVLDRASDWQVEPPPFLLPRIMANLPAKVSPRYFSWRVLHPIIAAASVILAAGLGFVLNDMMRDQVTPPAVASQQVRVIFYSPEASSVALVGDFNEWGQQEVSLAQASGQGIWEFTMNLEPGVYHYNLLVDGERWAANPKSSTLVPDGFGGYNSVLVVSEKCQSDCS